MTGTRQRTAMETTSTAAQQQRAGDELDLLSVGPSVGRRTSGLADDDQPTHQKTGHGRAEQPRWERVFATYEPDHGGRLVTADGPFHRQRQ